MVRGGGTRGGPPVIRCDRLPTNSINAIPGYRGYIPGKKAETVIGGLFTDTVRESQHATKKLSYDDQQHQHYNNSKNSFFAEQDAYNQQLQDLQQYHASRNNNTTNDRGVEQISARSDNMNSARSSQIYTGRSHASSSSSARGNHNVVRSARSFSSTDLRRMNQRNINSNGYLGSHRQMMALENTVPGVGMNEMAGIGVLPAAGDYREGRVLDSNETYYEEPAPSNLLKTKTNIQGYTGHIPGREAENVYGNTWTRTNFNGTTAFERTYRGRNRDNRSDPLAIEKGKSRLKPRGFYDMHQNRRNKTLFSNDLTAVERKMTDDAEEVPLFNNSYQDIRRGWSLDPWVGKQIDPAGREAPVTRQESYSCIPPPDPLRAVGYAGYIPGRYGENVIGERQTMTEYISKHRTDKNKAEKLER